MISYLDETFIYLFVIRTVRCRKWCLGSQLLRIKNYIVLRATLYAQCHFLSLTACCEPIGIYPVRQLNPKSDNNNNITVVYIVCSTFELSGY